jgi:hypothetical protein
MFDVKGSNSDYVPSNHLTILWDDTVSRQLIRSVVQWSVVPTKQSVPVNPHGIRIDRSLGDHKNTLTVPSLPPHTIVAFRVRDFEVDGDLSTAWSNWFYLMAGSMFVDQIELTLNNEATGSSTFLGTTLVNPNKENISTLGDAVVPTASVI